ncbi:agglutinin biogenesis protein MshP [Massilia niabensis]|uniref:Agglutinin biogenesis protein MshP n=1 Tax=Massilia niabensis TaxID=544910 RepID=A0ABW0L6D8_9BURK
MTQRLSLHCHHRAGQGGAGLVTAIFLLVVLAALAVALVTLTGAQRQSAALDEQGARAYQAARAGIEWALLQRSLDPANYCAGDAPTVRTFALPQGSPLADFVVTVTCTRVAGPASANPAVNLDRWNLRAAACTSTVALGCPNPTNAADYVARAIEVQI